MEDGAVVLRGITPFALPEGRYRVQVRLEEAKTRALKEIVVLIEDGHAIYYLVDLITGTREIQVDLATLLRSRHRYPPGTSASALRRTQQQVATGKRRRATADEGVKPSRRPPLQFTFTNTR